MARDFEEVFDVDSLDDNELKQIVQELLRDTRAIDANDIVVHVRNGMIGLSGRVGTDNEKRIAERVITDRLGVEQLENQLVVDPIRRAESPEAVDEHLADEGEHEGLLLGDRAAQQDPEADYLENDPEGELYGTIDRTKAMEEGIPWIPPASPTPEGTEGMEETNNPERDRDFG